MIVALMLFGAANIIIISCVHLRRVIIRTVHEQAQIINYDNTVSQLKDSIK